MPLIVLIKSYVFPRNVVKEYSVNRADGTEEHLPSKARVRFYKKDRLYIQTSGGGGWGNPLERDKKALKCDVKDGLISQERAEKEYGGC